jgi:hypothetical protein
MANTLGRSLKVAVSEFAMQLSPEGEASIDSDLIHDQEVYN